MIVELAVTDGPHAGKSYRFEEHATFIVGRSKNAHFSLPEKDPHLSRFHALIEVNPPLCRLQHLSETNPTLLNGAAVTQADLRDGDRVTVGQTAIVVRLLATEADAEPPTAALQAPEQRFVTLTADPNQALVFETKTYTEAYPAIPGYKIEAELGRGGMGVVYKAVRIDSGEPVALKMILPTGTVTSTALSRFRREADVMQKLFHSGIVQFRDSGVGDGRVWFAMEYVPGSNAWKLQQSAGTLAIDRIVGWMIQALDALAYAHERGFIHRDIKPENLLISGPPGAEVVKLADFGLAKAYEASPISGLTVTGQGGGTLPYMPPEQILDMRSVKPAADQYAAAATLYRLLTGQHAHAGVGGPQALMLRILSEDPPRIETRRADVSKALADAIHRGLLREPGARFGDCREFVRALREAKRGMT